MKLKNNVIRYCRINKNLSFVYDCKRDIEYRLNGIASDLFEYYILFNEYTKNETFNEFIRRLEDEN